MTIASTFDDHWIENENGCHIWQRSLTGSTHKYGVLYVDGVRTKAPRFAYERAFGPSDRTLFILHKCDEPRCVNPQHLFLGTQRDNTQDAIRKGRQNADGFVRSVKGVSFLDSTVVKAIRSDVEAGMRSCDAARKYKISDQHIYRIKKRLVWADL